MIARTDGGHVSRSPYTQEIFECLRSRWSATAVYRYLCRRYGPGLNHSLGPAELWKKHKIPSERSIRRYAAKFVPDTDRLPSTVIDEKLKGIDIKIDSLQELAQMIALSKAHVAEAVKMEDRLHLPLDALERAVHSHVKLVEKYQDLAFRLGLEVPADLPKLPIELSGEVEPGPTMREILEKFGVVSRSGERKDAKAQADGSLEAEAPG